MRRLQNLFCLRILAIICLAGPFCLACVSTNVDAAEKEVGQFLSRYCADCHQADGSDPVSLADLNGFDIDQFASNSRLQERVIRKLSARQMPPVDSDRPDEATYDAIVNSISTSIDEKATKQPSPGRTDSIRRLTRTEYGNAIRDLLALDIDVDRLLPADESSHGFDNVTVGELSPTLLSRYVTAAQKISRLAVGGKTKAIGGTTIRLRPDLTQEEHVPGLPLGTRGGSVIAYNAPRSGQYDVRIRLARDRNETVEGLSGEHQLELLLNRKHLKQFTVKSPKNKDHTKVDAHLKTRIQLSAGPHQLGVTFIKKPSSLQETKRQPFKAHYNFHRHPRLSPAIYQVSITGPYDDQGVGETPSRQQIYVVSPLDSTDEETCAKQILAKLMRRAFRGPVTDDDLKRPLEFFRTARADGDFDAGIELALASILTSSRFLFRVEKEPVDAEPGSVYQITDLELASRLSFFLWSSIPDDALLDAAIAGRLSDPQVLTDQVQRMLSDERSRPLTTNFASQWLYLRNLDSITPDLRLFPDFDDNLRQSFRRETELFVDSVLREDRSVLDLVKADYTFLNERLAHHYGIPHVYGSRFRRVTLPADSKRGGLLRHASILTVTSYATRTSPVIRGHWILKNLVGSPPPPPPADVPALKDNTVDSSLSVRERLAEHRANEACAICHDVMDPVGFSLENFDAVGRWRDMEEGKPIDSSGGMPDGSRFDGVSGLEDALLARPELFVRTLTEKLMTYGLGRGVEHYDAVAVRKIVGDAKAEGFRFSSLIDGIVQSAPFRMRTVGPH